MARGRPARHGATAAALELVNVEEQILDRVDEPQVGEAREALLGQQRRERLARRAAREDEARLARDRQQGVHQPASAARQLGRAVGLRRHEAYEQQRRLQQHLGMGCREL